MDQRWRTFKCRSAPLLLWTLIRSGMDALSISFSAPRFVFFGTSDYESASEIYRVCGFCEQVLPAESSSYIQNAHPCERCRYRPRSRDAPTTKHLYKILMSICTDKSAMVVVVFDRAARNLFGCSADEFLRFFSQNPTAMEMASEVLEGEMLSLVLRPPKGGYGQQLRAVSIVPLSSSFQPVMAILPQLYASGQFPLS
ncbi:uncharacterized protein [Physcomitrium patens]|uniref:uncharacterized protein isoform X1 n=1 Tax=Physcomitrium patens TaxID=3218 RepID=UPI000D16887F|nr:uncharacterized protein LOC112273135 isoform X1 [Physcomitrium patens]XP_024357365.1 uncharacterized protein LOC112273135 isoform X1 [Physcomitrium patens]|eukprot:XP_024357356.1 uncharacterized protein LOC112273135 isoform X1 [Physcomitrella patens]